MSSRHPGGLRLTARAARIAQLKAGERVLDVGCGDGETVEFLARYFSVNACGADIIASSYPNCIVADAINLPFSNETFDAVFFECVLSILDDPAAAIAEARRVLRRGGRLIVSDIYAKSRDSELSLSCLRELESNGYELLLEEDYTPALVTFAAESRALPTDTNRCEPKISAKTHGYVLLLARKAD
ncbi:MAG: class I SAM-dependent methyltransferase [Oscillospiraceae bacterium]|jgi:ubiquinone/menaquinone biosynthesis C-methylase UbiE|nr:class I SAM-dependent methyltransferase [Oscillospiraceae bacterium]